ncbi:hypothetical protein HDG34_004519 [Paraburkholderia sp. HC6.4b]|nr:hypothetical protein [Paraburkholderia sp. HC6.4b]MBB5452634.1 hypothetical protein [Paraburkholderia sp. Kb1A]
MRETSQRALAHSAANNVETATHRTDLLEQRRATTGAWPNPMSTLRYTSAALLNGTVLVQTVHTRYGAHSGAHKC